MKLFRIILLLLITLCCRHALAQITISGMVVDSVTLQALPATNIKLKHGKKGVISDDKGLFVIFSENYDTLVISRIGYKSLLYPIFGTEKDALFMLREQVVNLKEVVVNFYMDDKPVHTPSREIKPMKLGEGISSPFTYFSKTEKEKRVLAKMKIEYNKVQAYVDLVTSTKFRIETMEKFDIGEDRYYDLLAAFNEQRRSVQYYTDEIEITKAIYSWFESQLSK
jgi:hypothetical protein